MRKVKFIDLFAGCGGLSDGFEQTKLYHSIASVEWEKEPCKTLGKRLYCKWKRKDAFETILNFDIQRTSELISGWNNDVQFGAGVGLESLVKKNGGIDIIIGGPPCQAYSIAGRVRDENGMNNDYRNYLFESYLKVVDHFKPKVFVFENVPGLLSAKPGGINIVDRITKSFSKIGYEIVQDLKSNAIVDCTKYGVAQARKRVVILGVNKRMININPQLALSDFYENILPQYQTKRILTVKDAIKDLPKYFPNKESIKFNNKKFSHGPSGHNVLNHEPRWHSSRDISTFKMLTSDIESGANNYVTAESLKELYSKITGKKSNIHKYHVLRWNKPSNTIPAHLYKDGLRHIHPDPNQARTITVREAARLQSFDDDFEFTGSIGDQYKMVGNAVPPKLAKALAYSVMDFLKKYL